VRGNPSASDNLYTRSGLVAAHGAFVDSLRTPFADALMPARHDDVRSLDVLTDAASIAA